MESYSIYDLTTEMQTWLDIPKETLEKAKSSNINTKTSGAFARLIQQWENGKFDEAPEFVLAIINEMLNR